MSVLLEADLEMLRMKACQRGYAWTHHQQPNWNQASYTYPEKLSSYLGYPLIWATSKPKSPRLPVQAGPELPRDQCDSIPNSCPARSYWSSRLLREPERNTRHQDPGQQLQQVKWVKRLGSPLTNLDQPTNRHDTHLKLIWKCFEWKHVKETRPGRITNNQTEVKQATSTHRENIIILVIPLDVGWV